MSNDTDDVKEQQLAKFRQLRAAETAIYDAITTAKKGLLLNPSVEEKRALNEHILDLSEKRAILRAQIQAVRSGGGRDTVPMPTQQQVAQIGNLAVEVEQLTNDNLTAAAALTVATTGMKLANELVG